MITFADRLEAYLAELRSEGITDAIVTPEAVRSYQDRLRIKGFSEEELGAGRSIGLTDEEMESVRQYRIGIPPESLAGSLIKSLSDLVGPYRALGETWANAANFQPASQLRAGGSDSDRGNLVRLFTTTSTIPVGNPLPDRATIDLRVRRLDLLPDWTVTVSPASLTLDPGAVGEVVVRLQAGAAAVQSTQPRVAVEGLANGELVGGVVLDVLVPQLVDAIFSKALQLVTVTPCRLVDTRPDRAAADRSGWHVPGLPHSARGRLQHSHDRGSVLAKCLRRAARSTGLSHHLAHGRKPAWSRDSELAGWPHQGQRGDRTGGRGGAVSVYVTNTTNVVLDINGYFAPVSASTLAFYPLTPCRVADTRKASFPPGLGPPYLQGIQEREFPILNATSLQHSLHRSRLFAELLRGAPRAAGLHDGLAHGSIGLLVSTLNDIPGTIIANAAIVPAGSGGDISVYPSNDTDVIIDINGYFAPPGRADCRCIRRRLAA